MKHTAHPPRSRPAPFSEALQSILGNREGSASPVSVEGLTGSSRALFLANLRNAASRPILVLTAGQNTGESLLGDIQYFIKHEKFKFSPHFFPSCELLPYEDLSPLREISGERLSILNQLSKGECSFLIAPVEAVLQYVMPRQALETFLFTIQKGDDLDREIVETCLIDAGYTRAGMVEERGQFSIRGDILDIFVPAHENPARIEFFGDEVESLRWFDIGSQGSIREFKSLVVLPVRELCLDRERRERGIANILAPGKTGGVNPRRLEECVERIRNLGNFAGIEKLMPFFYSEKETLFDYLPEGTLIVLDEEEIINTKIEKHQELILAEYERARERGDVAAEPDDLYLNTEQFAGRLARKKTLRLNSLKLFENGNNVFHYDVSSIPPMLGKFDAFADRARDWLRQDFEITVVAPTRGHVSRVHELLERSELALNVEQGSIHSGFKFPAGKQVFVAEHEIFGRSHKHRYRRKPKSMSFQRGFKDLKPGDFLVHIDYGIGKYAGNRELSTGEGGGEFLEIHYADDEKLYLPMDGLAFIQKFIGNDDQPPPLDKLGSVAWKRQRDKVKKSIREMAGELLKLYAKREIVEGHGFSSNPVWLQEFADSFEFVETDDQIKAIEDVLEDLEKPKPMDRLVCGDVGFGKTEVAMRAAFQVVLDKKQVAVLVPTTILAQQHFLTFQERFREYPITIDMVCRFRTPRQQRQTLEKLKNGQVDIVIGTHRLLSNDVRFADLGLIIIDEEQRFGVKHKEKLKQLRATLDILTLTATPIPRTLHFSLMGVRDLSVIETPPEDRLSIKTYVKRFDEDIIREAILREIERGGQIFFVHNKVRGIHSVAEMIGKIVPQARLGIGHGQMPEKELEDVMKKFINKEIDILLSTSIIESGLDIPTANTIIVNRADQFGLAQLYQLRGRVGRYKHQAYAYFLIPGAGAISTQAHKRLTAIEEMVELGSGFQLAARDLEIRGTGNMLGHRQSGHINAVGFELYCKLIEDTVKELKGEKVEHNIEPEINFMMKGFIPKDYIPDLNQRLEIYRRLYLVSDPEYIDSIKNELLDRYGSLPEPVEKLLRLLEIKILCQKLHISRADLRRDGVYLTIETTTPISSRKLTGLLDDQLRLVSENQIALTTKRQNWRNDTEVVKYYLQQLLSACDAN